MTERLPERDLLLEESLKIMMPGVLDGWTGRREGLDDHLSLGVAPARTAGNLGKKLECPLPGTEVRRMQPRVRVDDADQGDIGKIQPLGDHLGSDEDVGLTGAEFSQNLAVRSFAGHRVRIHPGDAGHRKEPADRFLDALRADPGVLDPGIPAFRTA